MRVSNVHQRQLAARPAEVGRLIDSLASEADSLWPRASWPPMRFDRPLGVGAEGGHGPIRYTVVEYSPGHSVKFRFSGPRGFNGHHGFEVVPQGETETILRHILEMEAEGPARVSWPLVFRWLHDALIEDSLATAQAALGQEPLVRPWSVWVKILRWLISGGKTRHQLVPGRGRRGIGQTA